MLINDHDVSQMFLNNYPREKKLISFSFIAAWLDNT